MPKILKITAPDQHIFSAYLCEALVQAKGCILILPEIFGLTDFIKEMCALWAKQGYHTLAPALYDRLNENITIPYNSNGYKVALQTKKQLLSLQNKDGVTGYELPLIDIEAAKNYLSDTYHLPVAIIGFSFGGTLGWLAASRLANIAAIIAYYGTHIHQFIKEQPKCPVILHCAEYDDLLTAQQAREISVAHPEVEMHFYPVTHGFRCSHMDDFAGQKFDEKASQEADEYTNAFLAKYLIRGFKPVL